MIFFFLQSNLVVDEFFKVLKQFYSKICLFEGILLFVFSDYFEKKEVCVKGLDIYIFNDVFNGS